MSATQADLFERGKLDPSPSVVPPDDIKLASNMLASGFLDAIVDFDFMRLSAGKLVDKSKVMRELADRLDAEDDPELERLRREVDRNEKVVDDLLAELIANEAKKGRSR